ncbi:MAG: hypothetical protein QOG72_2468 [Sphingomonadales bacterium]|jgi:hypothetical protein|nr:hypothetical protein [Sphingomonadales bacterium]
MRDSKGLPMLQRATYLAPYSESKVPTVLVFNEPLRDREESAR